MILMYIIVSLVNVFIHVAQTILVIKSTKPIASIANCICYTFSAIVIKCISEVDLWIAIVVQVSTNFLGCYLAMWFCEKIHKLKNTQKNCFEMEAYTHESNPSYPQERKHYAWLRYMRIK